MNVSYQAPGVYVNEVPTAPGPIQGASTSVAAFIGATLAGPTPNTVHAVNSYRNFAALFADDGARSAPASDAGFDLLANGVYGFFNNGGTRCYVTRVQSPDPEQPTDDGSAQAKQWLDAAIGSVREWLSSHDAPKISGAQATKLKALLSNLKALPAQQLGEQAKDWLSWQLGKEGGVDLHARTERLIGSFVELLHDLTAALDNACSTAQRAALANADIRQALVALEPYDDISIVAAPGLTGEDQWNVLVAHCGPSGMSNRFVILDAPEDADWATVPPLATSLPPHREEGYPAAVYYPWIQVVDANSGTKVVAPPSGHIAGVYARVDAQRGVFKAPANEPVHGATGLVTYVSANQQAALNGGDTSAAPGINCIRRINDGILVWGARTVRAQDADPFKYVSTRRTFNYIRQSLESGMQWAVFEPNTPALWGQIVRNTTSFLTRLWQSGGLFGDTAAEAFYIKCDQDTNPPEVRDAGQVVTEVGVALSKPAEFVVFNLGVTSGSATPGN